MEQILNYLEADFVQLLADCGQNCGHYMNKSVTVTTDFFTIAIWGKACLFFEQLDIEIHILDATFASDLLYRLGC